MQRPDEEKRRLIADAAARLFASRPFHEVRLEDVAAEARVGKGTLYIYFASKEDLYVSVIHDGMALMVDRLEQDLADSRRPAREDLRMILRSLVEFAIAHPNLFELLRSHCDARVDKQMAPVRRRLGDLIKATLTRGNRAGDLHDPHPDFTANCVLGMVRSVFLFGPKDLEAAEITRRLVQFIEHGIAKRSQA